MVTAALGDEATVGVVEDEVPLQLLPGRRTSEASERRRLLVGEELHAHPHTQAQAGIRVLGLAFNPEPLLPTPRLVGHEGYSQTEHKLHAWHSCDAALALDEVHALPSRRSRR